MDWTTLVLEKLMVPQVMVTAMIVGGLMEILKRAVKATRVGTINSLWVKSVFALMPIPLGLLIGNLIIPTDGAAPPWAMGLVAGLISGTVYDALNPAVKAALAIKEASAPTKLMKRGHHEAPRDPSEEA